MQLYQFLVNNYPPYVNMRLSEIKQQNTYHLDCVISIQALKFVVCINNITLLL